MTSAFAHVVLIENTVGAVDLSWAEKYPNIKAILYAVSPGEQGAAALADILVGEVSPSASSPRPSSGITRTIPPPPLQL